MVVPYITPSTNSDYSLGGEDVLILSGARFRNYSREGFSKVDIGIIKRYGVPVGSISRVSGLGSLREFFGEIPTIHQGN